MVVVSCVCSVLGLLMVLHGVFLNMMFNPEYVMWSQMFNESIIYSGLAFALILVGMVTNSAVKEDFKDNVAASSVLTLLRVFSLIGIVLAYIGFHWALADCGNNGTEFQRIASLFGASVSL